MKFVFKAKTKTGEMKEGTIDAPNKDSAISTIQKNNLFPIFVTEKEGEDSLMKTLMKYYDRVTEKELVVFFRQLAILIEAKIPIVVSLTAILEQNQNHYFKRIIQEMINDVEDGVPLSNTMEKHKNVFSVIAINVVKTGEFSGNLSKSINYVADNIEKNYTLSNRIKSAMIYPAIIMVVFFIIGFLVITIILPKLTIMIKELKAEVPWYTRMVIAVGDFMQGYWWAVLIIIFGFIGGFIYYLRTEKGHKEFDVVKIKIPIIGNIFRGIYVARFAENLGVLLTGGIPIVQALETVSAVIGNVVYESLILKTAEEVKNGGQINVVLRNSPLMPPMVTHMVKIGEESGQIESVLKHIAKFYETETENATKNLSTLIEPILMIIIGVAVGFLAFAVLMPIYDIAGQIK